MFVLDASVLVELAVAGRHQDAARGFLLRYGDVPRSGMLTAAHGLLESTQTIRRFVLHGKLDARDGQRAVSWLGQLDVVVDPPNPRLDRIWSLRDAMSSYDAAYAAAAESLDLPLVTVDRRLLRACATARIAAVHLDDAV